MTNTYPFLVSELSYPFVYLCKRYGAETTVTRSEARDLCPKPDSLNASDMVWVQRGWVRQIDETSLCSDCASGIDLA